MFPLRLGIPERRFAPKCFFVRRNCATHDYRNVPKSFCLAVPLFTPFAVVAFTTLGKKKNEKQQRQHSSALPWRDCHEVDSTQTARAFLCSSRVHGHCSVAPSARSLFGSPTARTHTIWVLSPSGMRYLTTSRWEGKSRDCRKRNGNLGAQMTRWLVILSSKRHLSVRSEGILNDRTKSGSSHCYHATSGDANTKTATSTRHKSKWNEPDCPGLMRLKRSDWAIRSYRLR